MLSGNIRIRSLFLFLAVLMILLSVSRAVYADDADVEIELGDNYWIDDGSDDEDDYQEEDNYWIDDGSENDDDSDEVIVNGDFWEDDGSEDIIEEPEFEEEPEEEEFELKDIYYYEDVLDEYIPLAERLQPFVLADDSFSVVKENEDNSSAIAVNVLIILAVVMIIVYIAQKILIGEKRKKDEKNQ